MLYYFGHCISSHFIMELRSNVPRADLEPTPPEKQSELDTRSTRQGLGISKLIDSMGHLDVLLLLSWCVVW